eukprot:9012132-Pyramimonas_sp.AAC.1
MFGRLSTCFANPQTKKYPHQLSSSSSFCSSGSLTPPPVSLGRSLAARVAANTAVGWCSASFVLTQ